MTFDFSRKTRISISHRAMIFISGMIGFLYFIALFGVDTLVVTNVDWIYNSNNDIVQHYIGWLYYRSSNWEFPLGIFPGLTGEMKTSIVYTDSIPLFAIVFKLLRGVLPETFQYLGIFTCISIILQSVCGSELVHKLTGDTLYGLLSSYFFLSATVLGQRLFEHTSLTCHAIILVAIILFLEEKESKWSVYIKWNLLLIISVMVHAYYVPMVLGFELFYYIRITRLKDWLKSFARIAVSICVVIATMYIVGYFYKADYLGEQDWLWQFGISLNTFWNSQGRSLASLLVGRINSGWEIEEGYAYLGAGMIIIVSISIIYAMKIRKQLVTNRLFLAAISLAIVFVIISTVPTIRWNWDKVITIPLPNVMTKLLGIFRSNGRFIWPSFYLVMAFSCALILKKIPRYSVGIVLICLMIQLLDLLPFYRKIVDDIKDRTQLEYVSEMNSSIPLGVDYMMLMGEVNSEKLEGFDFYETAKLITFAAQRGIDTSDSYISRKDAEIINSNRQIVYEELLEGRFSENVLYVFSMLPYELLKTDGSLYYYSIDGMICAVSSPIGGRDEIDFEKGIDIVAAEGYADINLDTLEGEYVKATTENIGIDLGHCLYKEMALPSGSYKLVIEGSDFDSMGINIAGDSVDFSVEEIKEKCIEIKLCVHESSPEVILQLSNCGGESISVNRLLIYN